MCKQKYFFVSLFAMLLCTNVFSQNSIAGIWEGKYLDNFGLLGNPKLVVEIFDVKDSSFAGITHLYYEGNKYEHYKMLGWYSKKDSLLVFMEAATIAVDLGIFGNCLGTYSMALKKEGKNLYQYGNWQPNKKNCTTNSLIWLQKKNAEPAPAAVKIIKPAVKQKSVPAQPDVKTKTTPQTKLPPISTQPQPAQPPFVIKTTPAPLPEKITQRQTDLQQLIEIAAADKDSIKIEVYDNGEIDGDTISLYYGSMPLAAKKLITDKALTFFVSLSKSNPISHLRLVAESLGSIPPCTALMVVTTKSKRYEVRLSSNFNKNAAVELFLKE
jgi:hypothetical protein